MAKMIRYALMCSIEWSRASLARRDLGRHDAPLGLVVTQTVKGYASMLARASDSVCLI
jgi:hypothetical protein